MDAQKDAQTICKVLKINGYISPMLHSNNLLSRNDLGGS